MTTKELFETLKARFSQVLKQYDIENDTVEVTCRALTPQEAIGETKRKDFPIITGKDVMPYWITNPDGFCKILEVLGVFKFVDKIFFQIQHNA